MSIALIRFEREAELLFEQGLMKICQKEGQSQAVKLLLTFNLLVMALQFRCLFSFMVEARS